MTRCTLAVVLAGLSWLAAGCDLPQPEARQPQIVTPAPKILARHSHGRLEELQGLRLLRLWGKPAQRGAAHAALLGAEAVDLLRRELTSRFGGRAALLTMARGLLPSLIAFPESLHAEIKALFTGISKLGVDLQMPAFGRAVDLRDFELISAMDIVGLMGCSGFTLYGDQVEGGGVLTARNFDWPLTGPYLLDNCILIVQHPEQGQASVSVSWPGYVGTVTGINEAGVATFLHVGDSPAGLPKPGCWPAAAVARQVLSSADADRAFARAAELLPKTTPPVGYLFRVVTPRASQDGACRVFEADRNKVSFRPPEEICLVTNHFTSREKRGGSSANSLDRVTRMDTSLRGDLGEADHKVSVAEAWEALETVQVDGRGFATLHSLVFRHQPWVFELRIGQQSQGRIRGAVRSERIYKLSRAELFRRP